MPVRSYIQNGNKKTFASMFFTMQLEGGGGGGWWVVGGGGIVTEVKTKVKVSVICIALYACASI